jgi:precorrin-6B methylase 2
MAPRGAAVRATTALRARVGALHDRLAPPFQLVLERLLTALDGPALGMLVELDLPAQLDQPHTAAELAAATGAETDVVDRVCSYLASRGCLRRDRRGRYRANGVTKLLAQDEWAGWVKFVASPWSYAAMAHVPDRARAAIDPMVAANGADFFTYLAAHAGAAAAFHDAQAAGAQMQSVLLADALDVASVRSVCDVGGSTGSVIAQLLTVHPHLRGCVLDRPEAESGARATFATARIEERAEFVGGDFFAAIPAGHDLHLLTAIVHDWGDDDAVRILRRCADALEPGGRIVVVELVVDSGRRDSFAAMTDMLMLAYTKGGRERSAVQFHSLWERAGLRCTRDTTLPSLFHAMELQPR